jgi:hypothetical protein
MPIRDGINMSDEDAALYDEYKDGAEYHHRLQMIFKIKLNSLYGALSNKYFRFYNLLNGESTTATGREILFHQCGKVNERVFGIYDKDGEAVLAGDTDSCYFAINPEPGMTVEEIIAKADDVADYVNGTFQSFMREQFLCNEGFDNLIRCVREIVARRAILIKKKKYIFYVIDAEGHRCEKIKSTGVDIKKTTIPKPISKKLNEFIERLLKGEDWDADIAPDIVRFKNELETGGEADIGDDIMILGAPMGVKNIDKYTKDYKVKGDKATLPGHVAGSIHWNEMLKKHGDVTSPRIMSGMKIRVFYLTKKFGKFKNIAVPGDIEILPDWFVNEFVPIIDRKLQLQKLVDGPIKNIIKALGKEVPSNQTLVINQLLVF